MLIIIIVAVVIAVFSIYDVIIRENNGNVMIDKHNEIIKLITKTENIELRKQRIKDYLDEKKITKEEANELY